MVFDGFWMFLVDPSALRRVFVEAHREEQAFEMVFSSCLAT